MVASPWEHHLFCLVDTALIRWVSWISRSSKELIIHCGSTATKWSLSSTSELVLPVHCGSSTVSQSSDHQVMIGSTLNIGDFRVEQGKDHRRWANVIWAVLVWNWFSSIIIKHIELWGILLLSTKLSEIIPSHSIYKTTGSKQQSMLKSTSNFWYESALYLFQRLRKQRMFKHLHETAGSSLHLGVELFTQIHVDIEIFELIAVVQSALVRRIDLVFVNVYDGLLLRLRLCKDQVHHILYVNISIRVLSFQFFSETYGNIDFPFLAEIYHPILCDPNILDLLTSPIAILIGRILLVLLLRSISSDDLHLLQTYSWFRLLLSSCDGIVDLALVDADALVLVESVVVLVQQFAMLVCFYLEEVAILSQYYVLFYLFNAYLQIY